MKLLRLTSDSVNGSFDGYLNQEIEIPEKSQVALQSAVFETQPETVIIDSSNDAISFQTANATGTQTISLQHTDGAGTTPANYNDSNSQLFFDDITNKINANLKIINSNQIGKQFRMKTHTDGKVDASFLTSAFTSRSGELASNIAQGRVNGGGAAAPTLTISGGDAIGSTANADDFVGVDKYKYFTHFDFPITKGAGIFRLQLRTLERISATQTGGFTIALSARNPHTATGTFTDADIVAGIQVLSVTDANMDGATPTVALPYSTIINGVATASAVNTNAVGGQLGFTKRVAPAYSNVDPRMDHIELAITGNDATSATSACDGANIEMNVYRRTDNTTPAGQNVFIKNSLATTPYASHLERGADLYAYIFIHGTVSAVGGAFNCRLQKPRYTADPFMENENPPAVALQNIVEEIETIGAKPEPPKVSTLHNINFGEQEVYLWLGYSVGLQPNQSGRNVIFKAQSRFGANITADAFLVQLLNLKVESYDAHITKQSRQNILSVIPADNENNRIVYEPNNLLFIDLNNKFPLKISNLRLRIVRQDYSEVPTRNLSSITLIINTP
tara:strand:- start:1331 stop:3019 length:1689 start_codon:yes stop_codon:yes gene_type:complete